MKELVPYLQDAVAIAFVALGALTAITWSRRRDRSTGYLALAIILLAAVSGLGRLQAHIPVMLPFLGVISLAGFMGTAYALVLYRSSLIPLPRRWHVAAIASLVAASALIAIALARPGNKAFVTVATLAFVLVWCVCVGEPIVRFWLVARHLPPVQAWRLRSLSLGFGGIVAILLFAVGLGSLGRQPIVQVAIEIVVLAIIPLLYASFAPPAWLRRQWRSQEEESLRAFMEELLVSNDRDALSARALELATRLVGGDSAVLFDGAGKPTLSRGLQAAAVDEIRTQVGELRTGIGHLSLDGGDASVIVLPIAGLSDSARLVIVAGPFTPAFGGDEMTRTQQLMSAFVTALDRHHLMVQLEQSNVALQEANRHKSVFLANMSHELRTPLNAIIGFSELLTDAKEDQFDEATRKRFLTQIVTSGKHLLGLINDILDLSKVEAGQMELRLGQVNVAEVVDQVARTVEPLVVKKDITLTADVAGSGDILADAGKLKQMLLNLVSNAIKFTPEGGSVTIATKRTADAIEISVADTGIGIDEAEQRQIFHEFHQVDQGPGRKHEGTGLGLALTKRFALLHGGDVRVTSRVDKGSVFTLVLPARAPAPAPTPAEQVAAVAARNGQGTGSLVLVVEDDPAAAELLTRQLVAAGYRTVVARTGNEALARAHELQPVAITLDIILPEVDGWEVITRLKSDERTSSIPIIVVSVVDNPELGMALGAIDYFVKPVDANVLIQRLRRFDFQGRDEIKVLVVDDEPANRTWLTRALEPAGFTVVVAAGGREAIELARSSPPDFVLLDLMMPEVTGFDVVEALRADPATRETPIMVFTASTLSAADRRQLNGRVSQILSRGSVGSSDIVSLVKRVAAHRNGNGHKHG